MSAPHVAQNQARPLAAKHPTSQSRIEPLHSKFTANS